MLNRGDENLQGVGEWIGQEFLGGRQKEHFDNIIFYRFAMLCFNFIIM